MKRCLDCQHSFVRVRLNGDTRHCNAINGKPMCINAREKVWTKMNKERECGPEGKLWERS